MSSLIEGAGILRETNALVFDIAKDVGEGLSIFLSDQVRDSGSSAIAGDNQWIIDVAAKTNRAFFSVGRVLTTPPRLNVEPRARLVAIANIPGAIAWQITARGAIGQRAYVELVSGGGVGAGFNGLAVVRPRPRDFFRGVFRNVTNFDTVLLDAYIADTSPTATPIPAGGLFVQFFNANTPPALGAVPIFETPILPGASLEFLFDAGQELGDGRYTQGLSWGLSTTPGVFTPALGGQMISVTMVLG